MNVANTVAAGKPLFDLLQCQKCHLLGAIPADQPKANLAPDLRMVSDRLQPDWIIEWLKQNRAAAVVMLQGMKRARGGGNPRAQCYRRYCRTGLSCCDDDGPGGQPQRRR